MNTITTQTCTKCPENGEQPIANFHRRRNTHQTICKSCRNASAQKDYETRGKSKLPHTSKVIQTSDFPAIRERIAQLEPRLRSIAVSYSQDKLEADDLYSEIVVSILIKCKPESTDGFIIQCAKWSARAYLDKRLTYDEYVHGFEADEDAIDGLQITISASRVTEDDLMKREALKAFDKVIKTLPIENQKIIALLSVGMNQSQIAVQLSVSEQTVSDRMKKIRTSLSGKFQQSDLALN